MAYGYPQYYPQIPYYNAQQTAMPDQLAQLRAAQQPMMQQPAQPSSNGLIWVQGEAGAKSYLVANGASVLLMDSEKHSFYIKSTDQSGMPMPLRIFDYTERTAQPQKKTEEYATREELKALEERISALMEGKQDEQ